MRSAEVRNLYEAHGPKGFLSICRDLLEGRTAPNGAKLKLGPKDFGLRAIWEGTVGPCEDTLPSARDKNPFADLEEQVNSTMFVALTKMVLAARVIEAYDSQPGIGDQLVTRFESDRRLENIAGFGDLEGLEDVAEGELYKDSSVNAKYVTSEASKRGRLLSITEEAVREDRTGQLLLTAGRWGEIAKDDKEATIINGVTDLSGNVYRPSGAAQALYSVANKNLIGHANTVGGAPFNAAIPLTTWADFQRILQWHSQNVKTTPAKGVGRPMTWQAPQVLAPAALEMTALSIINATEVRETIGTTLRVFRNPIQGKFSALSSPFIVNQADWYIGNFKKQFLWHEILPVQVTKQDASGPEAFERDVIVRFKVRYFGGISALDTPYVMKVIGA